MTSEANTDRRTHYLKCHTGYYDEVEAGRKTFEIRFNDRSYQTGDTLVLIRWDEDLGEPTGPRIRAQVTYITKYAQQDGWVVMAINRVEEPTND